MVMAMKMTHEEIMALLRTILKDTAPIDQLAKHFTDATRADMPLLMWWNAAGWVKEIPTECPPTE
jgi:hypothetical protein